MSAASGFWKDTFTMREWLVGIALGVCLGAALLAATWLLVGEPRV